MIDPGTAAVFGAGLDFIGGGLSGGEKKKQAEHDRWLQQYLGSRQLGVAESGQATDAYRRLEMLPNRDRVLYQLMARMGQTPAAFNPQTVFNGGQGTFGGGNPSLGGIDFAKLQGQTAAYTPGAGGTRPDFYNAVLQRLGFPQQNGQYANAPQSMAEFKQGEREGQYRAAQERGKFEAANPPISPTGQPRTGNNFRDMVLSIQDKLKGRG